MQVSDLVHRFLGSIGGPKEAEFYVSLFRSQSSGTFAALAVSDSVVREAAGALVADLTFLSRLGLRPVVVLGVGGGQAATPLASDLTERLAHIPARLCTLKDAAEVSRSGQLAVVALEGPGDDVASRFDALTELVRRLQSRKVVFLGRRSGIQRSDGSVQSLISLETDFDSLDQPGVLDDSQRLLLQQVKRMLETTEQPLTASVTSPLDLLRELFTVKGAGSLIRRGSHVDCYTSYDNVDVQRLRDLIQRAFDKPAAADLFDRPVTAIYVERDYRGAALITPAPVGSYLSKFAVDVAARGEGLGSDLWKALTRDHPRLVWRSRPNNPITPWYAQVCDGVSKARDWYVFWRGLDAEELPNAIHFALSAPVDFDSPTEVCHNEVE